MPVFSGLPSACVWHIYVCAVVMPSKVNEGAGASKGGEKAYDTKGSSMSSSSVPPWTLMVLDYWKFLYVVG